MPLQSVDEILERRRGGDLYRYLLEKSASFSGISGVQPKILVRDEKAFAEMEQTGHRLSQSYKGAAHIVKMWEPNEYPQLAANEYFCLEAARKCGLDAPPYRLAEDGMALVIDRFDLRMDGTYRGFEDLCVLNGRRTDGKYRGSYETSGMKRFGQFANSTHVNEDMKKLFPLIALNCALRNGNAYLKNFGIVYDDVQARTRIRPRDDFRIPADGQHGSDTQRHDQMGKRKRIAAPVRDAHGRLPCPRPRDSRTHRQRDCEYLR